MINLQKLETRKEQVINLKKQLGIPNLKAEVVLALDFSMSMSGMFSDGTVQELLERILPIGLQFDDNGQIDSYLFESGVTKVKDITMSTIDGLANYYKKNYSMGGTNYAPAINQIIADKCNPVAVSSTKKGLFGGLFGKKEETTIVAGPLDYPIIVFYVTDGANSDVAATKQAMIEASKYGAHFVFIGIGNSEFPMLEKLDDLPNRVVDNATFFKVPNLNTISDDHLYNQMLKEIPSWLPQARSLGQIKP